MRFEFVDSIDAWAVRGRVDAGDQKQTVRSRAGNFSGCRWWDRRLRVMFVCLLIGAFMVSSVPPAQAEELRVGVAPNNLVVETKPGGRFFRDITFINGSDFDLKVVVTLGDFVPRGSGRRELVNLPSDVSATTWVYVNEPEFYIPANSQHTIGIDLRVPEDNAAWGDHYVVVFFEARKQIVSDDAHGTGLNVSGKVGMKLLISVGQHSEPQVFFAKFNDLRLPGGSRARRLGALLYGTLVYGNGRLVPWLSTGNPLWILIPIRNDGTVYVIPDVRIRVLDRFGTELASFTRDEEALLPGDTILSRVKWDRTPSIGLVRVRAEVDYGGPTLLRKEDWVFLFPWRIAVSILAIVLAVRLWAVPVDRSLRDMSEDQQGNFEAAIGLRYPGSRFGERSGNTR